MKFKFRITLIVLSLSLVCSCKQKTETLKKANWVKLFNGKDLNDWIIKIKGHPAGENFKNTFIVEDGIMKVNYKAYDSFNNTFGHIYFKKTFSNYKFRMKYRFTGEQILGGEGWAERNSGVMIHCEDPNKIGLDQNFPVSIEVQLLGGLGSGERSTGNLCTPGTHVYKASYSNYFISSTRNTHFKI